VSTGSTWESTLSVTIYAHMHPASVFAQSLTEDRRRAVIRLEGANSAQVVLFAARSDLLRLHATISAALADLDAAATAPCASADTAA
jgi:hypothetical protein